MHFASVNERYCVFAQQIIFQFTKTDETLKMRAFYKFSYSKCHKIYDQCFGLPGTIAAMALSAIFVAGSTLASTEQVLPLTHGIYADDSQTCLNPVNAGLKSYDGVGLNSAHTHACRLSLINRQGNSYSLRQECVDAGAGPGPLVGEDILISVISSSRFVLTQGSNTTTFNYCAPFTLPPGLQPPM
ncbi:hypothetical protein [Pseudomonas sp. ME-P-057]|uniref:hypothetical protein n=1 Tax=Pseudomonas sp. ME-P-057 TaxID=3040321 RepID=UPI002554C2F4|nr:hypothetical protein [Pseudomonas sp. ME-P-057]